MNLQRAGLLLALSLVSCAEEDAQFNVKSAPGFAPGRTTVSVFGVFHDGRMSPESWPELGPRISAALGAKSCDIACGEALQRGNPDLFSAADEDARANGITEELLEKFAGMAKGETILTLSIHERGRQTTVASEGIDPTRSTAAIQQRGSSGLHNHRKQGVGLRTIDGGVEIAASLYSVRLHRSVARVAMQYTGTSMDEALRRFTEKLETLIPGSTCLGWNLATAKEDLR